MQQWNVENKQSYNHLKNMRSFCATLYKTNTRPTQLFIKTNLHQWRQHVSAPISEPGSGLTQFPNQNLKKCYSYITIHNGMEIIKLLACQAKSTNTNLTVYTTQITNNFYQRLNSLSVSPHQL
jgi:hypothetical protein